MWRRTRTDQANALVKLGEPSAVADPGSVKRGGRESKFLDSSPRKSAKIGQKNKNRPKKGGAAADSAPPGSTTDRSSSREPREL